MSDIVERLRKRTEDKATWPNGAWSTEPDRKQWTDAATGLECLCLRGPSGSWCGYVGVPEGHAAHGFGYYEHDVPIDEVLKGDPEIFRRAKIQKQINDLEAHGGLTFSGAGDGKLRPEGRHWFGFDCAHAGDFSPKYDDIADLGRPTGWGTVEEYRTLDYAMNQCVSLAKQLAAISATEQATMTDQVPPGPAKHSSLSHGARFGQADEG